MLLPKTHLEMMIEMNMPLIHDNHGRSTSSPCSRRGVDRTADEMDSTPRPRKSLQQPSDASYSLPTAQVLGRRGHADVDDAPRVPREPCEEAAALGTERLRGHCEAPGVPEAPDLTSETKVFREMHLKRCINIWLNYRMSRSRKAIIGLFHVLKCSKLIIIYYIISCIYCIHIYIYIHYNA